MAKEFNPHKLSYPQVYLLSMLVFVGLVGFLTMILLGTITEFFGTNPGLNGLILGVLAIGIILAFQQVLRLFPEVSWVKALQTQNNKKLERRKPVLLAPMAEMFKAQKNDVTMSTLSTLSTQSILDSVGNRLDERREISRYLIALLVFLGLLGTFWGLLGTIGSIGDTIQSLDPSLSNTGDILGALKSGLTAPLEGMGTAFSSSLFGLAGSLVLGFLDLQSGQAQNRFYLELENWLSSLTDIQQGDKTGGGIIQRTQGDDNINALAIGIQALVKQVAEEQKNNRKNQEEIKMLLGEVAKNTKKIK